MLGKLPCVRLFQRLFVDLRRVDYHRADFCLSFCQRRFTQLIERTTNQLIP